MAGFKLRGTIVMMWKFTETEIAFALPQAEVIAVGILNGPAASAIKRQQVSSGAWVLCTRGPRGS